MTCDKAYFIAKFEAIPEDKWCLDSFTEGDACCALGHCGARIGGCSTPESKALCDLFLDTPFCVDMINDRAYIEYQQPTPKQRILAALKELP